MNTPKINPVLSGLFLLAAGVMIGRWSASAPGTSFGSGSAVSAARGLVQAAEDSPGAAGHTPGLKTTVETDTAWLERMRGPERAAALEEKARGVLFEADAARRIVLFATLLEHLRPGDYDTIIRAFASHDRQGRFFIPEFDLFSAAAGRVDGRAVMDAHFQKDGTANDKVMAAWALAEPSAAIEWWNQLPDGALRDSLAKTLISGVVRKDFALAWNCLNTFPAEDRPRFMGELVRQKIAEGGFEASSGWLLGLEGEEKLPLREKGFDSMYNAMPNLEPDKKAEYLERFSSEPWMARSRFPAETAAQWAQRDGEKALVWAAGLPPEIRDRALPAAMAAWAAKDRAAAAAWFSENAVNLPEQSRVCNDNYN